MYTVFMDTLEALTGKTVYTTKRLVCRRWRSSDIGDLFQVYSDPEGARWVDDGKPITQAQCEAWLTVTANNYRQRGYGMFALDDAKTGKTLGFCGLVHPGNQSDVEVKYALKRSLWGKGLASEAVLGIIAYGSQELNMSEMIATVAPENLASQRVLLKAGFVLEAEYRDEDGDFTQRYRWVDQ